DAAACAVIQQNIASCGATDMTTLLRRDARKVDFANSAFDMAKLWLRRCCRFCAPLWLMMRCWCWKKTSARSLSRPIITRKMNGE
ncbi:hypothetical protein N9W49_02295, partial [Alphaproteobacteria bacterium]|nr:hypothetical protein [Alphaproteobacteria bacterium]